VATTAATAALMPLLLLGYRQLVLIKQLHLLGRWHAGAVTVRLYAR
jgi:hypothetical protein